MVEGLVGGVLRDEDDKPEVEAPEALAGCAAHVDRSRDWMLKTNILLALLVVCSSAQADDDVLLKAVAFALTGSDGGHVTAVDWDQCVFRVEQVNFSETYHLNNIDPTRLRFEQSKSTTQYADISYFVEVSLFGKGTVYEFLSPFEDKGGAPLMQGGVASYQLHLPTREYQRVVEAWKYIYSHGCKGKISSS
jgi:hypothetical protein